MKDGEMIFMMVEFICISISICICTVVFDSQRIAVAGIAIKLRLVPLYANREVTHTSADHQ